MFGWPDGVSFGDVCAVWATQRSPQDSASAQSRVDLSSRTPTNQGNIVRRRPEFSAVAVDPWMISGFVILTSPCRQGTGVYSPHHVASALVYICATSLTNPDARKL